MTGFRKYTTVHSLRWQAFICENNPSAASQPLCQPLRHCQCELEKRCKSPNRWIPTPGDGIIEGTVRNAQATAKCTVSLYASIIMLQRP